MEVTNKIKVLEEDNVHKDSIIANLQTDCDVAQKIAVKLNKQLNEDRKTFREAKADIVKAHRSEVKELKKDIKQATKKPKIKKKKSARSLDI